MTYTIALAENAAMNGVEYIFDSEVIKIDKDDSSYKIGTTGGDFVTRWIINCAGLYSYKISRMLGFCSYRPTRVKGEYIILDKRIGNKLQRPVYPTPNADGVFDVHVTPTIDGNILVGPTIDMIGDRIDYSATQKMIDLLGKKGRELFSYL